MVQNLIRRDSVKQDDDFFIDTRISCIPAKVPNMSPLVHPIPKIEQIGIIITHVWKASQVWSKSIPSKFPNIP